MSAQSADIANLLAEHISSRGSNGGDVSRGERKGKKEKKEKKPKKEKKDKKQKPPKKGKLNLFQALSSDANLRHTLLKILGGTVLVGGAAAGAGVAIHHYFNSSSGTQQLRPAGATTAGIGSSYGQPPPQATENYGYGYGAQGNSPQGYGAPPSNVVGSQHSLVYGQDNGMPPQQPVYGSGGGGSLSAPLPMMNQPPSGMGGGPTVYDSGSHGIVDPLGGPRDHPVARGYDHDGSSTSGIRVDPTDVAPATIAMIANDPRVEGAVAILSQQGYKVKGGRGGGFGKKGRPSGGSSSSSSSSDSDSD